MKNEYSINLLKAELGRIQTQYYESKNVPLLVNTEPEELINLENIRKDLESAIKELDRIQWHGTSSKIILDK